MWRLLLVRQLIIGCEMHTAPEYTPGPFLFLSPNGACH